jgi:acetate kinase
VRVLVLNAGSSSLKAGVVESGRSIGSSTVDWGSDATAQADRAGALSRVLDELFVAGAPLGSIDAVAHRVVHGGARYTEPTLVDDEVVAGIRDLAALAPLHNGIAAEMLEVARRALPDPPHVAVFDTAFHVSLADDARTYALPLSWRDEWGIRRYGFHGLSVEWAVERAAELLGTPATVLGLVVAHLGSGCSVTAVDAGRSVDTSMGLTPLEGVMMGTRAGSIDPGILLHVLRAGLVALDGLEKALEHESGLVGVSGTTSDVRRLQADADAGDERAALALRLFARRAAAGIAAAATALPAVDAIVFTGGIGEHANAVRRAIVDRLAAVGVAPLPLDAPDVDAILSTPQATPAVLRIEAREDLVAARHAERALMTAGVVGG